MSLNNSKRIISIDSLRAFALFGILMVHVAQLYNFYNPSIDFGYYSAGDEHLRQGLLTVFEDRCRTIFCILFGVSFFIIMRNAAYTTLRFCWRSTYRPHHPARVSFLFLYGFAYRELAYVSARNQCHALVFCFRLCVRTERFH